MERSYAYRGESVFAKSLLTMGAIFIAAAIGAYTGQGQSNGLMFIGEILLLFMIPAIASRNIVFGGALTILFGYLNGLTLSGLLWAYNPTILYHVFLMTALAYGTVGFVGATIARDLSGLRQFLMMALILMIVYAVVGMFFPAVFGGAGSFIYSVIGSVVFLGFTLVDFNIVRRSNYTLSEAGALMMGITLYLDFINLFIMFLSLFGGGGRRR